MDLCQTSWWILTVILLLGAAMNSNGDSCICPCSQPPRMEFTETLGASFCCEDNRHRYKCIDGYTRKAGTSNLIKCEKKMGAENPLGDQYGWTRTDPSLKCIRDPKLPAPLTTQSSETYSKTMASTKATQQQESTETSDEFFTNTTYTPPTYETTQNPHFTVSQSADKDRIPTTSTPHSTLQARTQEPTRETKSADPTCRTTSYVDTPTSAAEEKSSIDSVSDPQSTATITGLSVVGILVLVLVVTGLGIFLRKRRPHNNDPQRADEQVPMNPIPKNTRSDLSD